LTGAEFDSDSIPRKDSSEAPVAMLNFEQQSIPKKTLEPVGETAPADPFATADSLLLPQTESSSDPDFSSSVLPGQEEMVKPKEEFPSLELVNPGGFSLTPEPAADMALSDDEEKVYDLEDFGASPASVPEMDPESVGEEQTFDLSAFGAIPVSDDEPQNPDQVFELSDFGAAPMDTETPEAGEDVYDLSEFNASPLEPEAGVGSDDAAVEEDIFDLSDFGAKPMT